MREKTHETELRTSRKSCEHKQLLCSKDDALLLGRDALLLFDKLLDVEYRVSGLHIKVEHVSRQVLDLHEHCDNKKVDRQKKEGEHSVSRR